MTAERTAPRDWHAWHDPYDLPGSPLAVRLAIVQSHIRQALDSAPRGEIRVISLCAGQGRDLLGVLGAHPRAGDVRARLVELDERNAAAARHTASALGLDGQVDVICGDASDAGQYRDLVPARLVLCCGVFGNIADEDVERVVSALPAFCDTRATVVWTRHRRPPDLTPTVRTWFTEAGLEEIAFWAPEHLSYVGVGAVKWPGPPCGGRTLDTGRPLFTWVGDSSPPI